MRLTNTLRDAFVNAAMQDVPSVDYREQAQKILNDAAEAAFTKAFPNANYKALKDAGWIDNSGVRAHNLGYLYASMPNNFTLEILGISEKLQELGHADVTQDKRLYELRSKLKAVAYSVTTRKALLGALPEFEKYLPDDEAAACKTLPAVANLVADFAKAGWPKGKEPELAAA